MTLISLPRGPVAAAPSLHNPAPAGDIKLDRLYRAFVSGHSWRDGERTVFVEAMSRETAFRKIAAVVAAMEFGSKPEEVRERIYNLSSGVELVEDGISEDHALRLYEVGWSGSEVISWTEQPLLLVREPAALMRAWATIPAGVRK